jgi:hypothetical protein
VLEALADIDERDATDQFSRGSAGESDELREARKRIPLIEQENEVLRRAAAYLSQAQLQGRTGDFNRFGSASPQIFEQAGASVQPSSCSNWQRSAMNRSTSRRVRRR